jgi:hypothetical protein
VHWKTVLSHIKLNCQRAAGAINSKSRLDLPVEGPA